MMNLKKTVLITGAGGLLGSEIIKQLLTRNEYNIVAMTSQTKKLKEKYHNNQLQVISNDLWVNQLQGNNIKVDYLINCAFPRSSKPDELAQGIPFTEKLIENSIEYGIKNIINISSQSVYTQKEKETPTEETPVQPESLYGMTKYACERIVAVMCKEHGINYTNIRLASLTGLDFDVRMTNRFVKKVINNEEIIITGGSQKMSYLDVRDAAEALILMIQKDLSRWENTYNLGNQDFFTLLELVETIQKESKRHNIADFKLTVKDGDSNFNNLIDSTLLYEVLDWKPTYTSEIMINELFDYHLNGGSMEE